MGFLHEHQRPDRDQYVSVSPGGNIFDYEKIHNGHVLTPYDFESITHFGNNDVIQAKTAHPMSVLAGQRDHLSELDIQQININYPIKL